MASDYVGRATEPQQLDLIEERVSKRGRAASPPLSLAVSGLFAGIGGVELGLGRSGHESLLLCEWDAGANAVLDARFPSVKRHSDVTTLKQLPKGTELITAGFPCQDLSQAGKTAGIAGSRSGLVGEVFRLLERRRTPWVLLENVPFMLQLSKGRALDVIIQALEALGYDWAFRVLDSRAFGVPQRRQRVFLLASRVGDPRDYLLSDDVGEPEAEPFDGNAFGFYWTEGVRGLGAAVNAVPTLKGGSTIGIPSPPAILMPDGHVVKPDIRDLERLQGFDPDWTKPNDAVAKRGHRWKLVGNAVTVDTAAWIGQKFATGGSYDSSRDAPLKRTGAWPRAAWGVGGERGVSSASEWPRHTKRPKLEKFLKFPTEMLSVKATAGFLERARRGSLRFPPGFIERLQKHLDRMSTARAA